MAVFHNFVIIRGLLSLVKESELQANVKTQCSQI